MSAPLDHWAESLSNAADKKAADMTPMKEDEFLAAIQALGFATPTHAGAFFGVDGRTPRRWASGATAVPQPIAMWLRYMIREGLTPEKVHDLTRRSAITAARARRSDTR
ncbi:MAG: hypothetical protein J2P55_02100 [Rhizobiales bacterium]|nr:hypothetical protein [Hyphomicrobiales bacterium]